MRHTLLASLTACFLLAACADHQGATAAKNAPPSPINEPDAGAGSEPSTSVTNPVPEPSGGGPTGPSGPSTGPDGGGSPVPEPSTLLLVGTGLAGAALLRRRKRPEVQN